MCSRCDGFLERRRVNSPHEYRDLIREILETVEQGTFRVLSGTCPLEEILASNRWPGDYIVHVVGCPTCSRRFQFSVETYHGGGEHGKSSLPRRVQRRNRSAIECYGDITPIIDIGRIVEPCYRLTVNGGLN